MPSVDHYAASALRFMDARGQQRVDMIAHSLGVIVLAAICRKSPERIGRAVLACPVMGLGSLEPEERRAVRERRIIEIGELGMSRFAEERVGAIVGPGIKPRDRDECIAIMAEVQPAAYVQAWHMLCEQDLSSMLEGLALRPTILAGTDDAAAPLETVQRLHGRIGGELVTFEGVGHFPMLERAEAFASAVRSALQG
jgi:pimeloyl-ACP methyl ester carboxylesterase